jgi:hypothetical protein
MCLRLPEPGAVVRTAEAFAAERGGVLNDAFTSGARRCMKVHTVTRPGSARRWGWGGGAHGRTTRSGWRTTSMADEHSEVAGRLSVHCGGRDEAYGGVRPLPRPRLGRLRGEQRRGRGMDLLRPSTAARHRRSSRRAPLPRTAPSSSAIRAARPGDPGPAPGGEPPQPAVTHPAASLSRSTRRCSACATTARSTVARGPDRWAAAKAARAHDVEVRRRHGGAWPRRLMAAADVSAARHLRRRPALLQIFS